MKCLIIFVRSMRLLYDDPKADIVNFSYALPIGLGYISAVLKQNNHQIDVLNLNHVEGTVDEIIELELLKNNYEFVITGSLSPFYPNIKKIIMAVRKYAPKIKIILGGGLISSQPEIMFKLLEPDFAIIGEGEETIIELLDCINKNNNLNTVNGIIYRDSENNIKITNPRMPIKDINLIPWPDYEGFGFEEYLDHMSPNITSDVFDYPRAYSMITSRSCPFVCTFCYHPLGNKYRERSVENIMEEIEYVVKKYRINIITFYDELFAQNKERVSELCKAIKEFSSTIPWEIKWECQMRVDCLDENVVRQMKDAGCNSFSLGLESYSSTVLKSMKKRITPNQIDNALRICKRVGVSAGGNFIFGDIAETKETYNETLNYWKNHRDLCEANIGLTHIIIYQGSYIYKYAVQKGIIKDEIKFIEDRAKKQDQYFEPINFTEAMTNEEYQQMIVDFKEAQATYKYYAIPLVNIQTKDNHEIHVKCPFCHEITTYKNYFIPKTFYKINIYCRKCRSRFIIPSNKLRLKNFIFNVFGFRTPYRVAKWIYNFSDHLPSFMKSKIKKIIAE